MLHWVRAFLTIALIAAPFALIAPLRGPAIILVCVFAALAVLALITGLFGRTASGYSAERALAILSLGAATLWAGHAWLINGWTPADAARAVDIWSAGVLAGLHLLSG
jgi:hypothetical protein